MDGVQEEVVTAAPDHTQTTREPISDDMPDIDLVIFPHALPEKSRAEDVNAETPTVGCSGAPSSVPSGAPVISPQGDVTRLRQELLMCRLGLSRRVLARLRQEALVYRL